MIPLFIYAALERLNGQFSEEVIKKTVQLFVQSKAGDDSDDTDEEVDGGDHPNSEAKKLAVAPWCVEEIRLLCPIVQKIVDAGLIPEELKKVEEQQAKDKKKKQTKQERIDSLLVRKIQKALKERAFGVMDSFQHAMDIALSGRMATSGLMTSVDGALAVAHAVTTHAVEPQDVDWFTAVDDLMEESGDTGAGHLDTQQFSSGVFYRYASLNIAQLQENLGGASREQALEIARHVMHLLATVVPSAKQQSFAAHNRADFAVVSFADQPISLANAFEKPIPRHREGGYLAGSVEALADYWRRINHAYGLDERAAAFSLLGASDGLHTFDRLTDLENWIARDGKV